MWLFILFGIMFSIAIIYEILMPKKSSILTCRNCKDGIMAECNSWRDRYPELWYRCIKCGDSYDITKPNPNSVWPQE